MFGPSRTDNSVVIARSGATKQSIWKLLGLPQSPSLLRNDKAVKQPYPFIFFAAHVSYSARDMNRSDALLMQ